MDLGRTHRVVPPHLRRAVELRDQTCVFTGCQAPPGGATSTTSCTGLDGGETCLENSALLCERHHTVRLYMPLADSWQLFDNSDATGPRPIAAGEGKTARVLRDADIWRKLMEAGHD